MERSPLLARLLLGAALLTPIVFIPGTWYPYVVPKALLLHGTAVLGCAALLLRRVETSGPVLRCPSPVALAVALWIAFSAVSTIASVDAARSLWGTPARMQGLVTLVCAAALFVVARAALRGREDRVALVGSFVAAGSLASLIAVGEALGMTPLGLRAGGRPGGTLGNPVFLGGVAFHVTFLAVVAAAWSRKMGVRIALAVAALTGLAGVVVSETRGALLALVVGGAVAVVAGVESLRDRPRARRALLLGSTALALAAAALWVARDTAVVGRMPLLRRLAEVSTGAGTGGVRVSAWHAAAAAAAERPVLGWGPECFQHAADAHYPQNFALVSGEPDLDDAHNAGLHALVTGGALGLLAYLALVVAPIWTLVRDRDEDRLGALPSAALLGLLVAQFVHGLLAPRDVSALMCSMLVLALVDARPPPTRRQRVPVPPALRVGIVVAAAAVLVGIVVIPGVASVRYATALAAVRAGRPDAAALHERARATWSAYDDAYVVAFAEAVAAGMRSRLDAHRRAGAESLARVAAGEMSSRELPGRPVARPEVVAAVLALQRAVLLDDETGLPAAIQRADRAHARLPRRPDLTFSVADLRAMVGDADGALRLARAARDVAPGVARSWWRLAAVHAALGDVVGARTVVTEARARGLRPDRAGRELEHALGVSEPGVE